jgi:hypothetical protein
MAITRQIILVLFAILHLNNVKSQNNCECYKRYLDSSPLSHSKNIFLLAERSDTIKLSVFHDWVVLSAEESIQTGVDSIKVKKLKYNSTFQCLDSSYKRVSFNEYLEIPTKFELSDKEKRLLRKKYRLSDHWLKYSNDYRKQERINKRLRRKDIIELEKKMLQQMPVLIIPYQNEQIGNFEIVSLSIIQNNSKRTEYCLRKMQL